MKYMLMNPSGHDTGHAGPRRGRHSSEGEQQAITPAYKAINETRASLLATACSLRDGHHRPSSGRQDDRADGPFVETKEAVKRLPHLRGDDPTQAIELLRGIPAVPALGWRRRSLRPIMEW